MARRHDEAERLAFASRSEWRDWLSRRHDTSPGVFVVYPKKASRLPGPTYEDLIREALCFGWIDGTLRPVDEQRTTLYFCARRKGSIWAASNKARVEHLRAHGLMTAAGEALEPPDELVRAFARRPGAAEAFDALPAGTPKELIYRVDSAKRPDTRERRAEEIARALGAP